MTQYVAGIDFGTTNSSAAIFDGQRVRMVDLEKGKKIIPTALFFADGSNQIYYGGEAQKKYTDTASYGRFMRSMKRILGTNFMYGGTVINGRSVHYEDIIGCFVKYLKQKIDKAAGQDVESVVMGRPVHFRDNAPDEDKSAEEELKKITLKAGFKNVEFQYEPIAAAFAHEQAVTSETLAFVVDIGGGTSDFTVIRLSPDRKFAFDRTSDVLANTGIRIGGNDFDKSLSMKSFMPLFGLGSEYKVYDKNIFLPTAPFIDLSTWSSVNSAYNYKTLNAVKGYIVWGLEPEKTKRLYEIIEKRLGHKNLDYVEKAKIKLSSNENYDVKLGFLSDAVKVHTNRDIFETAIEQDIKKIEDAIKDCITNAKIKNTDIQLVILTGGSTEIPYINRIIQSYFPNTKISSENKLSSVGLGLAYDAMRRFCVVPNTK